MELDPVSESPIGHLGWHYLYARQYDDAIEQFQKALRLYPDASEHYELGDAYYAKGLYREAVEQHLKEFVQNGFTPGKIDVLRESFSGAGVKGYLQSRIEQLKAEPQVGRNFFGIALHYARLGEKDQAFEWLEKAFIERVDLMVRLKEEIAFDSIRSDPRYADLLRRIGLPQ